MSKAMECSAAAALQIVSPAYGLLIAVFYRGGPSVEQMTTSKISVRRRS